MRIIVDIAKPTANRDQLITALVSRLHLLTQPKNGDYYPIQKSNYFEGRVMTVEDFHKEQQYHRNKLKRHNRFLHGSGVVSGLIISVESGVEVSSGYALDCAGNEIVVPDTVELNKPRGTDSIYICLAYHECGTDCVPVPDESSNRTDTNRKPLQIEEGFVITYQNKNPCFKHKRDKLRLKSCGRPHAIPLAKLLYRVDGWQIDRRFRRPSAR